MAAALELRAAILEGHRAICAVLAACFTEAIERAKKDYKKRWPAEQRYRIKTSYKRLPIKRRTMGLISRILLRRQRGYRVVDRVLLLYLTGLAYRLFQRRDPARIPKFLRKSAMGVDVLFK